MRHEALTEAERNGFRIDTPERYCPRCGATAGPGEVTDRGCSSCLNQRLPWQRVVRLSAYEPPVSDWIVAMKFARQWTWAAWFGQELAEVIREHEDGQPQTRRVVCPVPMHITRRTRRGYNQAELIADAMAKALGAPRVNLLRRVRRTPPQTDVRVSDRAANVRGAFAPRPIDPTGWDVWLVDDVKTTGATLRACAKLLKRAGADRVHVAVAAVADPKETG